MIKPDNDAECCSNFRLDQWYLNNLVCPRDLKRVQLNDGQLTCENGHAYPVIDGIPIMLLDDDEQTIGVAEQSLLYAKTEILQRSHSDNSVPAFFANTLGIGEEGRHRLLSQSEHGHSFIDPVVSELIGATNGLMYKHLIGKLCAYPIPELRMSDGDGLWLLDIGCNWGRWSIAAARKGYAVVGIDPSLGAILAARRVSSSLGLPIRFVVGDARYLPFPALSFDRAFSYSVLQHFSPEDCQRTVTEIGRTLKENGVSTIQMPTILGLRCLFHQLMRRFREPRDFEVRYWSISSLEKMFARTVGQSRVSVDCFLGIGLQPSDYHLMPLKYKIVLRASEALRKLSFYFPPIKYVADSVYVESTKAELANT